MVDFNKQTYIAHQSKVNYVIRFMKNNAIPYELQKKTLAYFDFIWSTSNGFEANELTASLPNQLRNDVYHQLFYSTLLKVIVIHNR